ncbi:F0F1 ATP synthase subunit alpha [Eubacterium ruminantium]|uniref:F0F1 ATP synthase subunit alpha n=1 Tax=Eubacterium ruminantium TaxID=42322 RepID=UPI001567FCB7|nr:F0F1 ATP synthase subunit alpha [Eubacterium ruminantium]
MKDGECLKAYLYAAEAPGNEQKEKFLEFLSKKNGGRPVTLEWVKDKSLGNGFKLCCGSEIYDWTTEGRLRQFKEMIDDIDVSETNDVVGLVKENIKNWKLKIRVDETGKVISVGDGIAVVSGLDRVKYGEIVAFECGVKGMIQDLNYDEAGVILFGDDNEITEDSLVYRTGKTAGIPVGDAFIGRVVNALGEPVDGKGEIVAEGYRAIESPAPGIIDRQPVDKPMETGLLTIDSMFPIGKGQRELIIGDRQTGKTSIAVDTILNQKGKNVICVYVAIGQKASSIANLVQNLTVSGAMEYTVIVNASAGETAPIQFIAPYAGTALGEYFMNTGRDVLIVYDDLSKHAIAYRALSLLLERSPGREAYPGDVFYLHSRLLERSAHLSDERGGGSMTALPIVETQAGDVSAYIPTNIISITDGQIFLESDLFFAGQRPAVNVGLSVSRVGGAAQTKAMKKSTGSLRLDLAQYREMEVFTQFSSDLDEATKKQLVYGQGLMRLLRQPKNHPMSQHQQVISLISALNHNMQDVPIDRINDINNNMLEYFEDMYPEICSSIDSTGTVTDEQIETIKEASKEFIVSQIK